MATVTKDFKIKYGLIVEGTTATVNNFSILTKSTADQEYIVGLIGGTSTSANTANTVVKRDANGDFAAGIITATITGTVSSLSNHDTDDLAEGSRLYFTDARALTATSAAYDAAGAAAAAQSAAISAAAADATTKADAALTSAQTYADTAEADAISSANAYTDGRETAITSAYQSYADTAEVDAKAYTDTRETAITTAYQSYADTAEADAVTTANSYTNGEITTALTTAQGYADIAEANAIAHADALSSGLDIKQAVRVATTVDGSLSSNYENGDIVDGVTLVTGDRILVKDQSTASENGIYVVNATGAPTRSTNADTTAELSSGAFTFVQVGTENAGKGFVVTSAGTLGTDPVVWSQFSEAGQFITSVGTGLDVSAGVLTVVAETFDAFGSAATAETNANSYTNGRETAITTAYQSYADTAEADAISTASADATSKANAAQAAAEATASADATSKANAAQAAAEATASADATAKADAAELAAIAYADALTTSDIAEGTNLYHTDARAKTSAAELLTGASLTNITITGTGAGLTITAENGVADSTTSDLTEGSNLYFTAARAVTALEAVVPNFTAVELNSVAKQIAATLEAPTAGSQVAHSFAKASYRSAEYLVKVAYGTHTEISKVLITLDTADNIAITEYGTIGTNGSASTISAGISGTDVQLLVTTVNNNSTVTVMGTLLV